MIVVQLVVLALGGAVGGFGLHVALKVTNETLRAQQTAQHDAAERQHEATMEQMAAMRDAIVSSASETSKAIGSAVQAAMSAPAKPPRQTARVWELDADIRNGTVDDIDPTDVSGWLARSHEGREDVAMLRDGESPIPGVEMRP